jgi:hypothetical protein
MQASLGYKTSTQRQRSGNQQANRASENLLAITNEQALCEAPADKGKCLAIITGDPLRSRRGRNKSVTAHPSTQDGISPDLHNADIISRQEPMERGIRNEYTEGETGNVLSAKQMWKQSWSADGWAGFERCGGSSSPVWTSAV